MLSLLKESKAKNKENLNLKNNNNNNISKDKEEEENDSINDLFEINILNFASEIWGIYICEVRKDNINNKSEIKHMEKMNGKKILKNMRYG